MSNVAMPTLTGNMASLWVGLGAVVFFKERQGILFWIGLIVSLTGISLLVINDYYSANGMFMGLVFGMLAGMFYATFMLLTQKGRTYLDTRITSYNVCYTKLLRHHYGYRDRSSSSQGPE